MVQIFYIIIINFLQIHITHYDLDRYFNIQQASEIDSHLFTVDTTTIDGAPSKSVTIGRFQDFLTDDDVPHSMANSLMMDSIIRSKDY